MQIFLTSSDLPDVPQPIECRVISGWQGWGDFSTFEVEVVAPFEVVSDGQPGRIIHLILAPFEGRHRPDDPFFEEHVWVDVYLPAQSGDGTDSKGRRLCIGLIHKTSEAAQDYLPGWQQEGTVYGASLIENAALLHIRDRSSTSLRNLYQALLSGTLLVPLFADLAKDAAGRTDVPVRCIRLPNGEGCVPVFTSNDRLLDWEKKGSKYAEMPGKTLFEMVSAMPEIDCVFVNYSDVKGSPKGKISRPEFELLARGVLPEQLGFFPNKG